MSQEPALTFVEVEELARLRATERALQSQLGQAREQLLLAQADLEAVLTELRTYFTARTYGERGDARVQLKVLARAAHPGAALADEVRAARARAEAAEKNLRGMRTMLELSIELCNTPEHNQDEEWYEKLNAIQGALEAWDLICQAEITQEERHDT